MTAIPARVAGVREVIVAAPGRMPAVLAAALEAGVTRLFRIGGAHAMAALAYGTATVPRVDKIVGPGNAWVAAAKALVARDCGIDFYAGPTEIVIVSDDRPRRLDRRRPHRAGRARSRCARRADHVERAAGERASRRVERRCRRTGRRAIALARRRHRRDAQRGAESIELANADGAGAPRRRHEPRSPPRITTPARCSSAPGRRRSPATTPSDRTTCCRRRRRPLPRRPERRRLRPLVSVQRCHARGCAARRTDASALADAEGLEAHARSDQSS